MYSLCVRREMQIISAIESNRGIIKKREELFYQQLSGCLQQLSVYNEIYDLLNSSDISSRRLGKRKLIDYKEKFESGNITVDQPLGFQGDAYQKYWDYVELEFIKCVNDTNIKPYAIGQGVYIK
jgi:hypothetical protein